MHEHEDLRPDDTLSRRLWTPWRMTYVGGETRETGCIFCNRFEGNDDVSALILARSAAAFVIMNLFPYNTGHVMVVPNEHVDSPESASCTALQDMTALLPPSMRALRRVLSCHGFNVGCNVGSVAGAGVAEHLHEHVVPRWTGDANFMPIIGSTMVIPELIPVAYAKIRAELARELEGDRAADLIVLDANHGRILLTDSGVLPVALPERDYPLWKSAVRLLRPSGVAARVAGWAGGNRAEPGAPVALTLVATSSSESGGQWIALERVDDTLDADQLATVRRALGQLAPSAAAPFAPAPNSG